MRCGLSVLGIGLALVLACGCHTAKPKPAVAKPVSPPAVKPPPVRPSAFWPLVPGTSWTYAGALISGSNDVVMTNTVRLTCTVLEVKAQRDYQIVRLSCFPPALSPWETAPTNATYVLLRTPAGEWHAIEAGQARPVLARITDAKDPLDELLPFETQVLAEPLKAGLRWGDPVGMQRLDGMYCWVTGAPHAEMLSAIAGVTKDWKLEIFPIVLRTQPDRLDLQFAPNIGILATDYVHHGTPGEVHLKLIEFHQP